MTKLISALFAVAVATFTFNAQAASHAGAAPMKASEPMKKDEKKAEKKDEKKMQAEKKASAPTK